MAAAAVEMHDIVKSFPGVRALDGVSMRVEKGEVHALVGKNGAGKSTLMHILTGLYSPDSGSIKVGGRALERLTTYEARQAGVALVAQHARFVPGLSIAENLFCGALPTRPGGFVNWRYIYREAAARLARFGLEVDVRRTMESTTVAERQMIELARAFFADASVIILDEPTAPLPKHEVERLFKFVRRQRAEGAAFVYISHYLDEIFQIADCATVLRNGVAVGSGPIGELTQAKLIRMISGTDVAAFRRPRAAPGNTVLSIRGLSRLGAYRDVNLDFKAGEIVGLTGLEGSGPGMLARGLFALEQIGIGRVVLEGHPYAPASPSAALAGGVAYLPRDRHQLGIVGVLSVRENIALSVLRHLKNSIGFLSGSRERKLASTYIAQLGIKTPSAESAVETLSGGNQQKIVVAKLSATRPKVLLLDEPTQGVDVQAKVEILRIVDQLAADGVAVAVISDELGEMLDICDRILVFHRGRLVREFDKNGPHFNRVAVLEAIEDEPAENANELA